MESYINLFCVCDIKPDFGDIATLLSFINWLPGVFPLSSLFSIITGVIDSSLILGLFSSSSIFVRFLVIIVLFTLFVAFL